MELDCPTRTCSATVLWRCCPSLVSQTRLPVWWAWPKTRSPLHPQSKVLPHATTTSFGGEGAWLRVPGGGSNSLSVPKAGTCRAGLRDHGHGTTGPPAKTRMMRKWAKGGAAKASSAHPFFSVLDAKKVVRAGKEWKRARSEN